MAETCNKPVHIRHREFEETYVREEAPIHGRRTKQLPYQEEVCAEEEDSITLEHDLANKVYHLQASITCRHTFDTRYTETH
jgi:hypothetical protein